MINTVILLYLILHVLGDFYIRQIEATNYRNILLHTALYQLLLFIPFFIFKFEIDLLVMGIICGVTNFIVTTTIFLLRKNRRLKNEHFFFIEQIVKIGILLLTANYYLFSPFNYHILIAIDNTYLKWSLALLLTYKPSNVVFKHVFMKFKPTEQNEITIIEKNKTFKNAGATIGSLERILMLICLVNTLYSSIGLILTAKSIARYNRISEDPEFSEYYLLGTLSSVLFTIVIYGICFKLF